MLLRYRHALTEKLNLFGKVCHIQRKEVGGFQSSFPFHEAGFLFFPVFSRAFKKPLTGLGKQIWFLL